MPSATNARSTPNCTPPDPPFPYAYAIPSKTRIADTKAKNKESASKLPTHPCTVIQTKPLARAVFSKPKWALPAHHRDKTHNHPCCVTPQNNSNATLQPKPAKAKQMQMKAKNAIQMDATQAMSSTVPMVWFVCNLTKAVVSDVVTESAIHTNQGNVATTATSGVSHC
jgi:hypothetical protein